MIGKRLLLALVAAAAGCGGGVTGPGPTLVETPPEEAPLCEANPADKASGQGNNASSVVCIPSNPANTVQTCEPFSAQLHTTASADALTVCVQTHQVQCVRRACERPCVNSVTVTSDQGMYLVLGDTTYCAANEDGCRLGNVIYSCTCACPEDITLGPGEAGCRTSGIQSRSCDRDGARGRRPGDLGAAPIRL
jgi:hypothetical protein